MSLSAGEPASGRVRVRRIPEQGHYDRATVEAALDHGLMAHVAFVDGDQPYCIPMLYTRADRVVYIHGSTGSRAVRALAGGVPACLTVTRLDGIVLARSVFEHSANYESVMVLGRFHPVEDPAERLAAFEAFTEKLLPGRWGEARTPNRKELSATVILALPIEEASVKARSGGPDDDETPDAELDVWAGSIPLTTAYGHPEPSPGLRDGIPVPASVTRLTGGPAGDAGAVGGGPAPIR
jgi:nitroimidazol reductase NimA-like FMN-containing flavoprotein (pyridoxamine 5'-phosphate oxidase superfamily)